MAQQSARRDRDNQAATPYFEYAALIWTRSANSHAGRRSIGRARGRTDGSIRLRVTAFLMFSLALKGASTPSRCFNATDSSEDVPDALARVQHPLRFWIPSIKI